MRVCFGSWMLCIYVERCFEILICWLDLYLSTLLVAFISLCFSSLKNSFSSSSTAPRQIPFYRAFLSPFSIDPRQILDPSRQIFCALCLLDRFSIHWDTLFATDRSLIAPQQILFCWDLELDRFLIDPRSIEMRFSIYSEAWSDSFHSHFSSIKSSSLFWSKPAFLTKIHQPPPFST